MKKLLIENLSDKITLIQKADWEAVNSVFDALDYAFHPNGLDDEDPDERFMSLWKLFLITTGWAEDDYWTELEIRCQNHKCDKCREKELDKSDSDKNSN